MKNLCLAEAGTSIVDFSSQYHHESRCSNLLLRNSALVWFTHGAEQPPHYVVMEFNRQYLISKVGIFIHGKNNQNPADLHISLSCDGINYDTVVNVPELEHRQGDFLYSLETPICAKFIKVSVNDNHGGSGIFIAKLYAFGQELI
eukprot:TRINITY_DN14766_c0_g1_i1.p1 TRINITY_DN14766_c0_g1~~TRINITY_DN14766_c0_g1_i1.p1  ORF type:complete len:156 (+),score=35.69 TRINITY_DN14766_c0_g1_i1:36-470(+)